MALVTFRLPTDLAERFAALARGQGGKSAVLRRMVEQALESPGASAKPDETIRPDRAASEGSARLGERRGAGHGAPPLAAVAVALGPSVKVTLRLTEAEMGHVVEVAHRRGMNRTQWIASLVRARLGLGLPQTGDERVALRAIARELNRIGGNINQIARAANTEVVRSGRPASVDVTAIAEARKAIAAATAELQSVLARSAGYWDAAP